MDVNENYLNENGPCGKCGICDSGGFTPNPGCFNPDAPIMFIGHTPGETTYSAEKMRRDRLQHPERNQTPPSPEGYAEQWLNDDWGGGHTRMKKWLFGIEAENTHPTLTHPRESIYFTNLVKCTIITKQNEPVDISHDEAKNRNGRAYKECPKYLEQELKEINPEAILIAGRDTWEKFNSYFDAGLPTDGKFSEIMGETEPKPYHFELGQDYRLVPMYHWYHNNHWRVDWSEGKAEIYYSRIAQLLNSLVEPDVIQT